ncbi:hypothetical protein GCM10027176_72400 [Actinoallomurus bryophytorum]
MVGEVGHKHEKGDGHADLVDEQDLGRPAEGPELPQCGDHAAPPHLGLDHRPIAWIGDRAGAPPVRSPGRAPGGNPGFAGRVVDEGAGLAAGAPRRHRVIMGAGGPSRTRWSRTLPDIRAPIEWHGGPGASLFDAPDDQR